MIKELENKIGQLQYEISLLGLDQEDLTGVTIRIDELKDLVKNLSLTDVVKSDSEQLHKLLQYLSDEDELIGNRTHQQIIDNFKKLV